MENELFNNSVNFAYFILHKYFPQYGQNEDARQACLIGLWKASGKFDPAKGYAFTTFASRVIINQVRMFLREERNKNKIKYADNIINFDGEELDIFQTIADKNAWEVSLAFCFEELSRQLHRSEIRVLRLVMLGYTQVEISKRIGISQAHVSRNIQRIRKICIENER